MGNANGPFWNLIRESPTNIRRFLIRKFRYFNAIPRMEKKIDQVMSGETERAPMHAPQQELRNKFLSSHDIGKHNGKDKKLYANLTNIFVKSFGDNKAGFSSYMVPVTADGYPIQKIDDNSVPVGFFTLEEAKTFVSAHKKDPKEYSVEKLSSLMKIDEEKMKYILTHIKVLYETTTPVQKKPRLQYIIDELLPSIAVTEKFEDRCYQIMDTRSRKIAKYQKELLKQPDQDILQSFSSTKNLKFITNTTTQEECEQELSSKKLIKPEDKEFHVFEDMTKMGRNKVDIGEKMKEIETSTPKSIELGTCKIEPSKKADPPSKKNHGDKIIP